MMDNSIWSILDIIFVGAGMYAVYGYIMMRTKGEVPTTILMSKEVELRKCKDLEGYKTYIAPRLLVFGICAFLYGVAGLVNAYVYALPGLLYAAVMVVFFAVLVWFALAARKGVQMFW